MADDLYRINLQSVPGSSLYRLIHEFTSMDRSIGDRPREGYLLDYKEDVSDRFLRSVAAFANTFGGLLIVGVTELDGRPDKLAGVFVRGELKTKIASMIAANLFPCPQFEIAECELPTDAERKLSVVRVRETPEICLLAKKGETHPVYVRIEDQSAPADASQLRALLDRKSKNQTSATEIEARLVPLRNRMFVTIAGTSGGQRSRSETYFRIGICPYFHHSLPLDLSVERRFSEIVGAQIPGLQTLVSQNEAAIEFQRWRDWFEIHFVDKAHDYERRWHLSTSGDIGFATQMRWPVSGSEALWSLYDVALDISLVGKIVREFWKYTGYFGAFRLDAEVHVTGLKLEMNSQGFAPLFYERVQGSLFFPLDRTSISIGKNPQAAGQAQADFTNPDLQASLSDTVGIVLNQLLRCMGHTADLQKLRGALSGIINAETLGIE
jgi:hypothetical protein